VADQQAHGGSKDDLLEHFFSFTFASTDTEEHVGVDGRALDDQPFPLTLSLAAEASRGATLPDSPTLSAWA
jgi:hypothetical protein